MAGPERPRRVGYVLGRFPAISQTFVLNEILGLEQAGVEVEVFALKPALDPKFHSALGELRGSVRFVPRVDELKLVLEHNASAARRFRREYARALLYVIARPHNRLFWRFLQGGYIAELAARYELDHLHAHFATHATTVASLASMITRIPYSFTAHAFDIYKSNVRKDFLRDHIDRSDFVVTVSDANRQYLNEIGNGAGPKVFVVRNGIDLQSFSPADASPGEPFTIVAVARLVEKKGLNVLLDACRLLDDRARSFRCLILGCGPLRDQLQARIGQLDLAEQVRLLGSGTQGACPRTAEAGRRLRAPVHRQRRRQPRRAARRDRRGALPVGCPSSRRRSEAYPRRCDIRRMGCSSRSAILPRSRMPSSR